MKVSRLLAIMLGRLRMTLEECSEAYGRLARDLFPRSRRGALLRLRRDHNKHALEDSINQIVQDYAPAARQRAKEDIFASDPLQCKTACVSFDVKTGKPFVFRTYALPTSKDEDQDDTSSRTIPDHVTPTLKSLKSTPDQDRTEPYPGLPSVLDAARATSALLTFTPFKLGPNPPFDSSSPVKNPSSLIYNELRDSLRISTQSKHGPANQNASIPKEAIIEGFVSVGVAKNSRPTSGKKIFFTSTILRRNSDLFKKLRSVLKQRDSISSDETDALIRSLATTGDIASYSRLTSNQPPQTEIPKDCQKSQERVPEEPAYTSDIDRCAQTLVRVKQERQKTPLWTDFAGPLRYSQEQLSRSSAEYSSIPIPDPGLKWLAGPGTRLEKLSLVDSTSSNTCICFWKVPELFKELKAPAASDCFDNIVTLSRICGDRYWACTCLSFINRYWPEFGSSILREVSRICRVLSRNNIFDETYITCGDFTFSATANESRILLEPVKSRDRDSRLSESLESFERLVDCVQWLICALIPSRGNEGLFRTNMVAVNNTRTYVIAFKSFKPSPDHAHCWMKMFCYAHIIDPDLYTDRYPLPTAALSSFANAEPPGLKLDYELLWELAGIERAWPYDGGLVLNGFDTALIPLEAGDWPKHSRWHLWRTPGKRIEIQKLSLGRNREIIIDVEIFAGKLVYVGWALESKVLLGTSFDAAASDLRGSRVEAVHRLLERAQNSFAFQLQQALPYGGPATAAQVQTVWNYQSTLKPASRLAQFQLSLNESKTRQVILYDDETENATLVPELALLMFATLTYISHYGYTHFSRSGDPFVWQNMSDLKLPSQCYDIATESENVLLDNVATVVSKDNQGRGVVSFKEIVNAMTEIIDRGSNSCRQEITKRRRSGKGALYGFDLREAIRNEDIHFRRLKCTVSMRAWAAAAEQTSVIFVSGLGGLIIPTCEHKECLTTYPGLLSGTVSSLQTAFSRNRWRDNDRHRRIKDTKFQWTIRGTPFLECNHQHHDKATTRTTSTICSDICRIQTMSQNSNYKAILHRRTKTKRQLNVVSNSFAVWKGDMWSPRVWTDTCLDCDLKPKGAVRFGKVCQQSLAQVKPSKNC